jgi:peptide/nickel transport system substrate-binding protein
MIDRDGQVRPNLALSWTSDAGAKTWTFRLRPSVTFSNGAPFNADAVVAALDYLTGSPQPSDLVPIEFDDVAGYRALDPLTVEITGRGPIPLLSRAASVLCGVEPESWRRPKVEGLEFLFQLEATARLQSLLAGRSDIVFGVGVEDRATLETAGATLVYASIPQVTTLMLLASKPGSPFADVRVRRAVNHAVDKSRLVRSFFGGLLPLASQPAALTAIGHDPTLTPYPYDPAKAKGLLREAGYATGFTFAIDAAVGSSGPDSAVYQQIAQDLAAVGITMEVRALPGTLRTAVPIRRMGGRRVRVPLHRLPDLRRAASAQVLPMRVPADGVLRLRRERTDRAGRSGRRP